MGVRKLMKSFCISQPKSSVRFYNSKVIGVLVTTQVYSLAVTLGYLRGLEIPSLKLEEILNLHIN
jgi:hypothetical protein